MEEKFLEGFFGLVFFGGFFFLTQNAIIPDLESPKLLLLRNQKSALENIVCLCV